MMKLLIPRTLQGRALGIVLSEGEQYAPYHSMNDLTSYGYFVLSDRDFMTFAAFIRGVAAALDVKGEPYGYVELPRQRAEEQPKPAYPKGRWS